MAYNRNQQAGRRDDMPRELTKPADLTYPEIAAEYGIDKALWFGLQNLYPGAMPESIVMVYEYCKVRQLDPLKKPVHIVPMSVEDKTTGKKAMRDVIMPGIQEMRTTAARTHEYAGIDPPKFGPLIKVETQNKGSGTDNDNNPRRGNFVEVPEWCEITVHRLVQGKRYAFTHIEFFEEAVARNSYGQINAMWSKRPRGQLAKCTEAGGLRKAFPEELGGEYAAEEMEGRAEEDLQLQGLPVEPTHGASGIPAPEAASNGSEPMAADADDARDAGLEQATAPVPAEEAKKIDEAAKPAKAEPKPKPAPAPKPAASNDEEALRRMDERNAAAKAAPPPQQEVAACDWKVDLPAGAAGVLKAQREAKNVTEAQLLAKMGADIVVGNINQALGLLKVWE